MFGLFPCLLILKIFLTKKTRLKGVTEVQICGYHRKM